MVLSNLSRQQSQLQDQPNQTASQVLDFNFIKGLPKENDIVLALLEAGFSKPTKVEAAAKIIRRILIDQYKTKTRSGRDVGIERDGKKYIFNTYPELAEYCELNHLSRDQMGRLVRALENTEFLESIQPFAHYWGEYSPRSFRENSHNHTKAYRINVELLNEYLELAGGSKATNWEQSRSYTNCSHECAASAQSLKKTNNQPKQSEKERDWLNFNTNEENNSHKKEVSESDGVDPLKVKSNYQSNDDKSSESDLISEAQNCDESRIIGAWNSREERSQFEQEFYAMARSCSAIHNPRAYTSAVVKQIDRHEAESVDTLELWRQGADYQTLFSQFVAAPHPQQQEEQSSSLEKRSQGKQQTSKSNALGVWQINPDNTDLIAQGYEVGEPYPQFLKWAVERSQRAGETRQQTKLRLLTQFDFNPSAARELWRDYKQFLENQYQTLQEHEAKGLAYYPPQELKVHPQVSDTRAMQASVAINEKLLGESEALQATRQQVAAEQDSQAQLSASQQQQLASSSEEQADLPDPWQDERLEEQNNQTQESVPVVSSAVESEASDRAQDIDDADNGDVAKPQPFGHRAEASNDAGTAEASHAESVVEEVPHWLSPSAIAESVKKHQSSKSKGFKPYLSLINKSLKIGDNTHKRAILEIVQTLSETEKRQIKVPVMPEEESVADPKNNSQSEENHSQPDVPGNEPSNQGSSQSWRSAIAQLLEKVAGTVYEFAAVQAINQALAEVCQSEKDQILKLARDALDLESLAQIEVAF